MIDSASAVIEFNVNYKHAKNLAATGKAVHSDDISAGGQVWRIKYYASKVSDHVYIALELLSKTSSNVKAIFEMLLIDKYGELPAMVAAERTRQHETTCGTIVCIDSESTIKSNDLVKKYMKDGRIKFLCTIRMLDGESSGPSGNLKHPGIPVPPSDIVQHLGTLLDTADGTDLSITIDGETFHAHRAVLAARSPVFRAQLLGSMAPITLQDISPATFRVMLRFMYTDALPKDDELVDSPAETFENLLAAADRYALDRLKLLCAQKLWDNVSVDTVATMLACAERYNCPELKHKCIGFFAVDKNFRKAVSTKGFVSLVQEFPSIIINELKEGAGI